MKTTFALEKSFITLATAHEFEDEGPPFRPEKDSTSAPETAPSISDRLDSPLLHKMIRDLAKEEIKRIYVQNVNLYTMKAAENVILDSFQVSFESGKKGFKNPSFHVIEAVFT